MGKRILIVKERFEGMEMYFEALAEAGYEAVRCRDIPEAAEKFAKKSCDIVFVDLLLSNGDPMRLMAGVLAARPHTHFIAVTASGSLRQASVAMERGAFDFLVRPFDAAGLMTVVDNAARHVARGRDAPVPPPTDPALADIWPQIARIAPSTANVLLEGPTDAARFKCAQAIHQLSAKADQPFVAVPATPPVGEWLTDVLPAALLQQGGTVYFDDISRLKFELQTELLRFLQTSVVREEDGPGRFAQIRVICGCSSAPEKAVDGGLLREDLFYRLNVVRLTLPNPHRAEGQDRAHIMRMVERLCARIGRGPVFVPPEVLRALSLHAFHAGAEDLQDVLTGVLEANTGDRLDLSMLPPQVLVTAYTAMHAGEDTDAEASPDRFETAMIPLVDAGLSLADLERVYIETTIRVHGGSIPRAAQQLQVAPSTLYRKMEIWANSES